MLLASIVFYDLYCVLIQFCCLT